LNSGDWIENLTALEYDKKQWKLYRHDVNTIAVVDEYDFKRENKLAEEFITFLK
jgi:hypothetical protein